jgi:hypothetical protein
MIEVQEYPTAARGKFMLASGRVRYAGVVWDICTTVSRAAPDDRLRVGLPGESEASKLAHFTASKQEPWTKYNWKPTPRERRALLRLVDAELETVVPVVIYDPDLDVPDLTFVLASSLYGPPMPWPGQTAVERADSLRDAGFGWDGRRLPVVIPQTSK